MRVNRNFVAIGVSFLLLYVACFTIFPVSVKADSFYPSAEVLSCNFATATSISFRNLPANSAAAGGVSYNAALLYGESGNYPQTHKIDNIADITYPDARRYKGIADRVGVPPNTTIDIGFYAYNYSGHTITAHQGYLFLSRATTATGDWGRLGGGGSIGNTSYLYNGIIRTRNGRFITTGNIGTFPTTSIANVPFGKTIYSFTTIQPMNIQSRTATVEFMPDNKLRIKYVLVVKNISQYTLNNIRVYDDLPSGGAFDETHSFTPDQTKTFVYYANMGSTFPTTIANSPAVVTDPNRHKETASFASNTLFDTNPETRTLIIERDDAGHTDWRGKQPDFSASTAGEYYFIELLPYSTQSSDSTVVVPPNLTITKTVSDSDEHTVKSNAAIPGEELTYTIVVKNTGGQATNVVVVDDYPENYIQIVGPAGDTKTGDKIIWRLGNLENQQTITLPFQARVSSQLLPGTYQAPNNVTIDSDQTNPIADTTLTVIIAQVHLTIDKTVKDNDEDFGSANHIQGGSHLATDRQMTYRIIVTNDGNIDAHSVRIVDQIATILPFGSIINITDNGQVVDNKLIWDVGTLPARGSKTVEFSVQLNENIADLTTIQNQAEVSATESSTLQDTTITTIHSPILEISKDDGVTKANPGETVHWTINIRNIGTGNAYNIFVQDKLPSYLMAYNISDNGVWNQETKTIIWQTNDEVPILNGIFAPDPQSFWENSKQITFDSQIDSILPIGLIELRNIVNAQTGVFPPNEAEHILTITALPNNDIEKYVINETAATQNRAHSGNNISHPTYGADADILAADQSSVHAVAGDVLRFTITYRNTGNAHSPATKIIDHLPRHVLDVHGNKVAIIKPSDITEITDDIQIIESSSGYNLVWSVGELPVGQDWKVKSYKVRITSDSTTTLSPEINNRILDNVSYIASENILVSEDNDHAIALLTQPNIRITKSPEKTDYESYERVVYTIEIENTGSAKGVGTIKDKIPSGLVFESTSYDLTKTRILQDALEFDIGLQPAEKLTISMKYKVITPMKDLTEIKNTAILEYQDENNNSRPTTETTANILVHSPISKIEKTQTLSQVVSPGQLIKYTVQFKNIGSGQALNVTINDFVPEHTQFFELLPNNYNGTYNTQTKEIIWNIGTVKPNQTGEASFNVVIPIPVNTNTSIKNTAIITSAITENVQSNEVITTTSSCCMSGNIWDDANKNGLKDDLENPVPDVMVKISWKKSDYLPSGSIELKTDENGNYSYTGLPYLIPLTVDIQLPEGFDNFTTEKTFNLVLLPPKPDGNREDYMQNGIHYITATDCIDFLNVGVYRDIALVKTGFSPILPFTMGLLLFGVGFSSIIVALRLSRGKYYY